jgi:hypothetical protein
MQMAQQQSLDDVKRHASMDQETRERMTQIVQTNICEARSFANPVPREDTMRPTEGPGEGKMNEFSSMRGVALNSAIAD